MPIQAPRSPEQDRIPSPAIRYRFLVRQCCLLHVIGPFILPHSHDERVLTLWETSLASLPLQRAAHNIERGKKRPLRVRCSSRRARARAVQI